MQFSSYLNPKIGVRQHPAPVGPGIYALEAIGKDELLVVWGGAIVNFKRLQQLPERMQRHSVQVEEDAYLVSVEEEPADFVNHCCEPNAGFNGQVVLVAMRPIAAGEDICIDYAMCDGTPYDEFDCGCGSPYCRGRITGEDWRRPELWQRYAGYFSTYLQRRIERLKAGAG
ncbi:MAG: SET domain-containing protein-lysine N-methyltransferase [Anaerolineales bacterium]|nr:SET domain-containing protein-lysine N-methyltransferase [Anaerolineales bacterium]